MKPDRSRNDLIMLGMVVVLAVTIIAIAVLEFADRDTGEILSHVAIGIVGAVAGYVTAGRSKPDNPFGDPGGDYQPVDPGLEGDTGPDFGASDDDWFDDEQTVRSEA